LSFALLGFAGIAALIFALIAKLSLGDTGYTGLTYDEYKSCVGLNGLDPVGASDTCFLPPESSPSNTAMMSRLQKTLKRMDGVKALMSPIGQVVSVPYGVKLVQSLRTDNRIAKPLHQRSRHNHKI
jgi:hypothetical protein